MVLVEPPLVAFLSISRQCTALNILVQDKIALCSLHTRRHHTGELKPISQIYGYRL